MRQVGAALAETVLRPAQNGQTVTVGAGDTIVVRLPENPSTGFRWEFAGAVAVSDDFVGGPPAMPGAGGERVIRFVAPASGMLTIHAELRRAWEKDAAPQSRFEVIVSVN